MGWRTVICPQCQAQFDHPIMTRRLLGITFYPFGTMSCPRCKYMGYASEFRKPKQGEPPIETPQRAQKLVSQDADNKKLEDSKYEKD